jgi:hypothetical protein
VAEQLEANDVRALLEDVIEATENEQRDGAMVTRRSVSRRVESGLNQLRKYEVTAAQLRVLSRLMLDTARSTRVGHPDAGGCHEACFLDADARVLHQVHPAKQGLLVTASQWSRH